MAQLRPFRGLRADNALAHEIIAPPYDVVSEAEAKAIAGPNPRSFLHVTRPDCDMPEGADIHAPEAYQLARTNLDRFRAAGWLIQEEVPSFYLYRQTWLGRTQTGIIATCSVGEYDTGRIKRHELTRPDKEQDRVDHIVATDVQTGLVFLGYRDTNARVKAAMATAAALPVAWTTTTEDAVTHSLIVVDDAALVAELAAAFGELSALYVCDGHHRSAAASRVNALRKGAGSSDFFIAGVFPDSELEILAYNRLVKDLNGHSEEALLAAIGAHFDLSPATAPAPTTRGEITMYLGGQWRSLRAKAGTVDMADPVASLDVSVLQERVLGPLLGIHNPRTDKRVEFVGGIRGWQSLQNSVDSGAAAIAFHLYPTGLDQLFDVADADKLMPPKSTWFEPKLRGGVVTHVIA